MTWCCRTAIGISEMHSQHWLTPCWRSFFGWGNVHVNCFFSNNAEQYTYFDRRWLHSQLIVKCVRVNIVDAPVILIFRMGQRACHLPFPVYHRPRHSLWSYMTTQHLACLMCKTKNHWPSVDAHLYDGAISMPWAIGAIMLTNTFTLEWHDNAALWLSNVKDWKSLLLYCPLFSEWGNNKQPSYTLSLYALYRIRVIDIQYCVSNHCSLHPESLWPLDCWSTFMHAMLVRDDGTLLHSWASGRQLTECRSFH